MASESAADGAEQLSEFAETSALIQQIAAEARQSGQSLAHDPDAPDDAGDEPSDEAPRAKGNAPGKATGKAPRRSDAAATPTEETPTDEERDHEQGDGEQGQDGDEREDDAESDAKSPGKIDVEALTRALRAEGGVDVVALVETLGIQPEDIGVTPASFATLRAEKRKANALIEQATQLGRTLAQTYGDQAAARKAFAEGGDPTPAIEFLEKTFGQDWNTINKLIVKLKNGEPVKEFEEKRQLREMKKREAEREEQARKEAAEKASAQKIADAKAWITEKIRGDKLASPALEKQLSEAGFPSITDLVFEEMRAGYAKGLTDPRKALERVKQKLTRQARALAGAGLVAEQRAAAPAKPKSAPLGRPRTDAQTGAAGNGRAMTDAELRQAVLKEAGLWR